MGQRANVNGPIIKDTGADGKREKATNNEASKQRTTNTKQRIMDNVQRAKGNKQRK